MPYDRPGEGTTMSYQLGIDLGTTYTAAAVCRSSDRRWVEPEIVTLGDRASAVPSVLCAAPDGSMLVGEAAQRRAATDPGAVMREFKRRVGDPTPVVVAGRSWAPEELGARLVRWVVDRVAQREGGPASRLALTHPASWGAHKKDLLGRALAGQGLSMTFLAEPQAAALHYAAAERIEPGSTIAVYDLGGGTFDAAVVRKDAPGEGPPGGMEGGAASAFRLLGRPEGIERLGGVDFDEAVFEHVRAGMPGVFDELDAADPAVLAAVARIRRECTEAKEALSADTEASIPVLLPGVQSSVRLHRSEFEGLIRDRVEETVAALRRAVTSAGVTPGQLTAVLLVGGSSRIPLVAQLVSEQLGRPVAVDADPKNAIAKGAALAIAPRPSASWPEAAVPPVVATAPPVPPIRPAPPGAPPRRSGAVGGPVVARAVEQSRPSTAGPVGPPPPAARHSGPAQAGPGNARPVHARPAPSDLDWEYDADPEEPHRRPLGLLLGIGGLLAVAVIVAVLVLRPSDAVIPTGETAPGTDGAEVTTAEVAPTTGAEPDDAGSPGPDTGGGGGPVAPAPTTASSPPAATEPPQPTSDAQPTPEPSPETEPSPATEPASTTEPVSATTSAVIEAT